MEDEEQEVVLSGPMLETVVRMAETPLVGIGVKKQLLSQMGVGVLADLDLREHGDPEPASATVEPIDEREATDDE